MIKEFLFALFIFPLVYTANGQDVIVKKDGSIIKAKVFQSDSNEIIFRFWKYQKAPLQKIKVHQVKYIKYKNGTRQNTDWYAEMIDVKKGVFIDERDKINYKTISFAGQTWMGENLRASKTKYGKEISWLVSDDEWGKLRGSDMAYCYYNNDPDFALYGALYSWETAQEVCPIGWHLPSNNEWISFKRNIVKYFELSSSCKKDEEITIIGNLLKESVPFNWSLQQKTIRKQLGFSANLVGYRGYNGVFYHKQKHSYWWTATKRNKKEAYAYSISYISSDLANYYYKKSGGFSVRCIKD